MFETLSADELRAFQLFFPRSFEKAVLIANERRRFVHYTTAEVAFNIIRNQRVWMRNAMSMNDFSEIQYGTDCLINAWRMTPAGEAFRSVIDGHFPELSDEIGKLFDGWIPHLHSTTFLTCLSEHLDAEDEHGRLSMWRAYGGRSGVALVMNNTPFVTVSDGLKAYSSPVAYLTKEDFADELGAIAKGISTEGDLLRRLGRDALRDIVFTMFRFAVICTKHPGFSEELEWRIVYSPTMEKSQVIEEAVEVVAGLPQIIHKIPLRSSPKEGLIGASVPDLLERIIIGPTENQAALYQAFVALLTSAGVDNPGDRIKISGIPLRNWA